MKSTSVPNVTEARRIVRGLGGTISEVTGGGKHIKLKIVTLQGNSFRFVVSKAKSDTINMANYIRQEFNKADRRST